MEPDPEDQSAASGCLREAWRLRTRLAEVYREAEQGGNSPAETHRLLVVGRPRRPDPWRRLALPILIGRDLRAASPAGRPSRWPGPGPLSRWSPPTATC
jgi:hypothetical protein